VLQLRSAENTSNKFESGRSDKFPLQATDIGKVEFITLRCYTISVKLLALQISVIFVISYFYRFE